jgi:uncharacterized delta-60 repeat protein
MTFSLAFGSRKWGGGQVLLWLVFCAFLALTPLVSQAQTAARIYEFNGSYADTNGGAAMVPNGGTLGAAGYTFAAGQGPSVSNALANTGEYSIEMLFRINDVSTYRSLLNFNGVSADFAIYCSSGRLEFYGTSASASATVCFVANQVHRLVVTRNATTKAMVAYVDGAQVAQATDTNNNYVASASGGILHLLRDNAGEDSAGFLDLVRIYHAVLTPTQVANLANTAPADITLSATSLPENSLANSTVGTLSTTDADAGNVFTYTLVAGGADNANFTLTGSTLRLVPSPDFEAKSSYALRVRSTDNTGLFFEKNFTVTITNVNEMPSFTKGADLTHPSGSTSPVVVSSWATGISDGDATVTQALAFAVNVTGGGALFTTPPAIASNGTLTYTPSGSAGTATLSVTLTDDATAGGAALTTAPQVFTISTESSLPAINLTGNGVSIALGDLTPSAADHTQFGYVATSFTRTFTLQNIGNAALAISSIVPSGQGGPRFSVTGAPTSVAPGGSATFNLTYTSISPGAVSRATITVNSNDPGKPAYDFMVEATAAFSPIVGTISPEVGPLAGGTTVTITGNFFTGTTGVTIGGVAATNVVEQDSSTLVCTVPAGTAGLKDVVVTTVQATSAPSALFTYLPPPVITLLSPEAGSIFGGTRISITGQHFASPASATFNGLPATRVLVISPTRIVADAPAFTAGPASVLVTTPGGTNAANTLYTYMDLPAVTSVSPSTGTIYGGTTVTITGTGFAGVYFINFGSVQATINSVTPTAIVVTTPPRAAGQVNVVVATEFGTTTRVGGFTYVVPAPGEVDPLNANVVGSIVLATAVQPDGKTIIAGNFSQAFGVARPHLARLLADGTLDPTFNPRPDGPVTTVAVQPDGKILIGGQFTSLQPEGAAAPTTRNRVARLNADGTLDTAFDPDANGIVNCILPLPDGRILLGGAFNSLRPNGAATATARPHLARLQADGTLDLSLAASFNDEVRSLALQGDGKILVAGAFTTVQAAGAASPVSRNRVARLEVDGALDAGFNPNATGAINAVAVQADGRVLLAGAFTTLQPAGAPLAITRNRIARMLPDGALDLAFNPNIDGLVNTLAVQADGRVLLGGAFTSLQPNGDATPTVRNRAARVNADGTLDATFDPNPDKTVFSIAQQADGSVLLGGFFNTLQPGGAGTPVTRDYFVRLANNPASQTLSAADTSRVLWTRGGSAPDLVAAAFEVSTDNGASWAPLPGHAARVGATADWELTATDLPTSGVLRARGRTSGGYQGGASGLVEQVAAYTAPVAAPTVTAVSPAVGTTLGGDVVTITGAGFSGATAVTIGGSPVAAFTVASPFSITATIPAGVAGASSVRVTSPAGTNAANTLFTYVTPPAVSGISPALGSTLGGGNVTITGTGFTGATAVRIGGNAVASYVVDSNTQITAVLPAGAAGTASVTVTVPGAGSAANTLFTYVRPPTVSGVAPALGVTLGGETVMISGANFSLVSSVTFGGVAASSFTVNGDGSITATTPPGAAGPVSVGVASPGGVSATNAFFTYVVRPVVTGISPVRGSTLGGGNVTINGTGFTGATAVRIGGNAAANFVVNGDTQITAVLPTGGAGAASVTVAIPGAVSVANTLFTYVPPPTISGVTPASGLVAGGQTVTISGANFSLVSAVTFGGVAASTFTVNGDSSITATTPPGVAGPVSVGLASPVGVSAPNTLYTYLAPTTTTTLVSAQNPSVFNDRLVFTARVTSSLPGVAGQMELYLNNSIIESRTVDANGVATFSPITQLFRAGTYEVRAVFKPGTGAAAALYPTSSASLTQVVEKATLSIVLGGLERVYTGIPQLATVTVGTPPGFIVTPSVSYNGTPAAPLNVGSYSVVATITHPDFQGSATGTLVITKKPTPLGFLAMVRTYDGLPQTPTFVYEPGNATVLITYQALDGGGAPVGALSEIAPAQVGRYRVSVTGPNHEFTPSTSELTIVKRGLSVLIGRLSVTNNGQPRPVTVSTSPFNMPVTVTYTAGGVTTSTPPSAPPPGGGAWRVNATVTDNPNFTGSASGDLIITARAPAPITLRGQSTVSVNSSWTYFASVPLIRPGVLLTGTMTFKNNGVVMKRVPARFDGNFSASTSELNMPVSDTPYQITAEYSGDDNYLPAVSAPVSTLSQRMRIDWLSYEISLTYTGNPVALPEYVMAYLVRNPGRVRSYSVTYNGSTTPPTNATTTPVRVEVIYRDDSDYFEYRDTVSLHILPEAARIRLGNLSQSARVGANYPVQVITDPPGLAHTLTYNGATLPAGPNNLGTYQVVARVTNPNYRAVEARGTLVVAQAGVRFTVTNLGQDYDGRGKSVSVSASPSIPYVVTYNGSTRPPVAPGTYQVRVFPQDEFAYGGGSSHTLVIRARVAATVNGQENPAQFRLRRASGGGVDIPGFVTPGQNDLRLEFINSDTLRFKRWSDGSTENPRALRFGDAGDPASYLYNAEATVLTFVRAMADGTGTAVGFGYYQAGERARFHAVSGAGQVIDRWVYDGKTATAADGHLITEGGRTVYIKIRAGAGNPVAYFRPGAIAEGYAAAGYGEGTVTVQRMDRPDAPSLAKVGVPTGVNFKATAVPGPGYAFLGWDTTESSSAFVRVLENSLTNNTAEFRAVGGKEYSTATARFIKQGPELRLVQVTDYNVVPTFSYLGSGVLESTVHVRNTGQQASDVRIRAFEVTGYRLRLAGENQFRYFYPDPKNDAERNANAASPQMSEEHRRIFVNFGPFPFTALGVDVKLGTIGYNETKTGVISFLGSERPFFGTWSVPEMRLKVRLSRSGGNDTESEFWTTYTPTE